jgi:DNA primase
MKAYFDIVQDIDVDEFENAIGFEPMGHNESGEDWGQCPDPWSLHKHGDRTGKFAINREKKVYNCFVCGGGNLLSLTMAIRNCEESEAVEWLRQFASKAFQSDEDFLNEIDRLMVQKDREEESALPWFNANVLLPWEEADHPWFEERGITEEVRRVYRLGVNANTIRKLNDQEFVSQSIVLPHFWQERLVGWQNRWIGERPKWVPKYTNTGDFPKKTTLYGLDLAIQYDKPIVVVESVPTVLYLASLDIPAVATFGATVSQEQMKYLRRWQPGIILAQDNDQAGDKWRGDLIEYLDRYIPVMEMEIAWEDDIGETRMVENPEITIGLYNNPIFV